MTLILRYMHVDDIAKVLPIDRASFNPAWPAKSYLFELRQSEISYLPVLECQEEQPAEGVQKFINNLRGQHNRVISSTIVGYGGLWKMADEAHISTIASHPDYRGRGYGELLLAAMMQRAVMLKAAYMVLEVRVSNQVAQKLYRKYGFEIYGIKHGYYSSNDEDAYDMRVSLTDEKSLNNLHRLYARIQERITFIDQFSHIRHPRHRR